MQVCMHLTWICQFLTDLCLKWDQVHHLISAYINRQRTVDTTFGTTPAQGVATSPSSNVFICHFHAFATCKQNSVTILCLFPKFILLKIINMFFQEIMGLSNIHFIFFLRFIHRAQNTLCWRMAQGTKNNLTKNTSEKWLLTRLVLIVIVIPTCHVCKASQK